MTLPALESRSGLSRWTIACALALTGALVTPLLVSPVQDAKSQEPETATGVAASGAEQAAVHGHAAAEAELGARVPDAHGSAGQEHVHSLFCDAASVVDELSEGTLSGDAREAAVESVALAYDELQLLHEALKEEQGKLVSDYATERIEAGQSQVFTTMAELPHDKAASAQHVRYQDGFLHVVEVYPGDIPEFDEAQLAMETLRLTAEDNAARIVSGELRGTR